MKLKIFSRAIFPKEMGGLHVGSPPSLSLKGRYKTKTTIATG